MIISFVFPSIGNSSIKNTPIGGYKIVYEYSNYFIRKGYIVNILHPITINKSASMTRKIGLLKSFFLHKIRNSYRPENWFNLDKGINSLLIPYVSEKYVPDADFIFATSWSTAKPVLELSNRKGQKCYFLQSLETWAGPEMDVIETWKYPMYKIVIAKWLEDYAKSLGETSTYIPNGLDFDKFGVDIEISKRTSKKILMLYHFSEVKGTKFGYEAIMKLKDKFHDMNASFFGIIPRPAGLPEWINYFYCPSQERLRQLYNDSAIFISPSLLEGFPLPPAEAMMCGCALVATDIGGHREYCVDGKTALLVKPQSVDDIFEKVKMLIDNNNLRIEIANNAISHIKMFTWEKAIIEFEKVLKSLKYQVV